MSCQGLFAEPCHSLAYLTTASGVIVAWSRHASHIVGWEPMIDKKSH